MSLGGTIGELQSKMTYREYILWIRYFRKYGSVNPIRKYDRMGGIIALQINKALGGKAKMEDFIPFGKDIEENNEATIQEFIGKALGGRVKIGNRKRR